MYKLLIHDSAKSDLQALIAAGGESKFEAAYLLAILEELAANPGSLGMLLDHKFGIDRSGDFDVSKIHEFWRQDIDLWRLKVWDSDKANLSHRIVYAYSKQTHCFHVLAFPHREFNYDPSHPITKRILVDYAAL